VYTCAGARAPPRAEAESRAEAGSQLGLSTGRRRVGAPAAKARKRAKRPVLDRAPNARCTAAYAAIATVCSCRQASPAGSCCTPRRQRAASRPREGRRPLATRSLGRALSAPAARLQPRRRAHLHVRERVLQQADGALHQAVRVERLLAGRRLQVLRRLPGAAARPSGRAPSGRPGARAPAGARPAVCALHTGMRGWGRQTRARPHEPPEHAQAVARLHSLRHAVARQPGRAQEHGRALGNSTTLLTPTERASATESSSPWRQPRRSTPGMDAIGRFCSPSWMNTGRMRLAGAMCVSETAPRMVGLRRLRRGRDGSTCRRCAAQAPGAPASTGRRSGCEPGADKSGLTCGGTTGVPGGLPALCACVRSSLCSAPTCARTGSGACAFSPAPHLALSCWRPLQVCSNGLHLLRVPVVAALPMRSTGCPARQGPGRGAAGGQCVGAHHRPVTCVVTWQLQS